MDGGVNSDDLSWPRAGQGSLTDVRGLSVGHATSRKRRTGCTVIVFEEPYLLATEVRGGAPATRETAAFHCVGCDQRADALILTGGSSFGLSAADGVVRFLAKVGKGKETSAGIVPRVPGAAIYDLGVSKRGCAPDPLMGFRACQRATTSSTERGNVGAGFGATIGKVYGASGWMKGGLGTASMGLPDGTTVGALAVVNCFGDVLDPLTQRPLAGALAPGTGRLADTAMVACRNRRLPGRFQSGNTTLVALATDVLMGVSELRMLNYAVHDGIATRIRPAHTPFDGDVAFAVSTGVRRGSMLRILAAAKRVTEIAILDAVLQAESLLHVPALSDMRWGAVERGKK